MTLRLSKSVLSAGALVLAAGTLIVGIPRSAHAVAAALVQMTNSLASPGNTEDVSKQAAQLVNLFCNAPSPGSPSACAPLTAIFPYSTPANQSLVITDVDISNGVSAAYSFTLQTGPNSSNLTTVQGWDGAGTTTLHYSYTTGIAVPPNSVVYIANNGGASGQPYVTLHGYLTYQ